MAKLLNNRQCQFIILNQTTLCQFNIYRAVFKIEFLENLFQGGENGLIGELTCRNIYRHSQVYAFIPPLCHLAYDIENHPTA
ncbi:Uncharacterised protein [Shigella sonnei]|nr:Uncharacterised protein [Shigella sonnei]